ncbi:MAG: bifunctional oligoribonuclease/PAP phosphatase NrnA [Bacteroidetes bacterium]|nr:bifunctional oligoribonuclease/PAP phosphatase NrnA [Bacteroidota bacterium]NCG14227.1 bifunctional oligoribonuclease/PAP phosphatase NrnA [Bacteroidota bacterium]
MLQNILSQLHKPDQAILFTTHWSPDGDAIGSSVGLALYLRSKGLTVHVVLPNEPSIPLKKSPSCDADFVHVHESEPEKVAALIKACDVHCALDYNVPHRTGKALSPLLAAMDAFEILIDHHQEPDDRYDICYSDTGKGSTAEMVADLIEADGGLGQISQACAENLLMGLITDSGSFRYPSTSSHTLRLAAALMDQGAHPEAIHRRLFESSNISRLQLIGRGLSSITFHANQRAALLTLSLDDMKACGYQSGDTDGLVNWGLSVEGVSVSCLFREDSAGVVKCSFRSVGDINVNRFARAYFQGGGHANAAGGIYEGTLQSAMDRFVEHVNDLFV